MLQRVLSDEKTAAVHEISLYSTLMIMGMFGVEADRDNAKVALDCQAQPVLLAQLMKILQCRVPPGSVEVFRNPHFQGLDSGDHRPDRG